MRIAIIDSGLDMDYFKKYYSDRKIEGYSLVDCPSSLGYGYEFYDANGHGTACFSIINRYVDFAEYIIVKVSGASGKTSSKTVTEALHSLMSKKIDVICLAISGVSNEMACCSELESVCKLLSERGAVIVAAYSNDGLGIVPASFETVIGVSASNSSVERGLYVDRDKIDIVEDVKIECVDFNGCYIFSGNSLATSIVTGKIVKLINNSSCSNFRKQLLSNYQFRCEQLVYVQTPLEKEFVEETINRFRDHMDKHIFFEAIQLYEQRYKRKVEYEKINITACNSIEDACHQILKGGCQI